MTGQCEADISDMNNDQRDGHSDASSSRTSEHPPSRPASSVVPSEDDQPSAQPGSPSSMHHEQSLARDHSAQAGEERGSVQAGVSRGAGATIREYEEQLLGEIPHLTVEDLANAVGGTVDDVNDFWTTMGFPDADPESPLFTHRDQGIYAKWTQLVADGSVDRSTAQSLLRAHSHITDRLALWQVEAFVEDSVRRLRLDDTAARLVTLDQMRQYVDLLGETLVYSWQRQLHSLLDRVDHEVSQRGHESAKRRFPLNRSLGFVDMVSYTASSTILGGKLVGLIQRFEDASRIAVTQAGGRVVKMIGDAVFFIADDLPTGLNVVTSLIERLNADDDILPVRASFVRGDVFSRSGDVFGPPVNLASRLVDIAPVGRILTDPTTAAAVSAGKGGKGYAIETFPSTELRGFGLVSPYLLSRQYE